MLNPVTGEDRFLATLEGYDMPNPVFAVSPDGRTFLYSRTVSKGSDLMMIENFRSGLLWRLTRSIPCLRAGLKRAGFSGGWL